MWPRTWTWKVNATKDVTKIETRHTCWSKYSRQISFRVFVVAVTVVATTAVIVAVVLVLTVALALAVAGKVFFNVVFFHSTLFTSRPYPPYPMTSSGSIGVAASDSRARHTR